MKRVVFLSGDVHYAFAASLDYWDHASSATAKIIDYTSSPLRNEGSSSQMAALAVGYPYLYHLLRRTRMPTLDFFAWDVETGKRHILKKMLTIIRSRTLLFWWSVPRFLDALRTPYEIVLPAKNWPKRAFKDTLPDRSYRLRYIPDSMNPLNVKDLALDQRHRPRMSLARLTFRLKRIAIRAIAFAEGRLEIARRKLARRSLAAEQAPEMLPRGTHRIVRGSIKGASIVERRLEKRKNRLTEALFHHEEWLSKWKAGVHIIGYANIGEIDFRWTPGAREVIQRLWWWHPDNSECPTLASQYSDTLELPPPDAAPPLP
ncbi:MAG: hypothetical protein E6J22_02305 [Chloroflexi bacterium]|nr:MAG: hypothetical protein E6J22_02305 [Chloroflexota bacterium]